MGGEGAVEQKEVGRIERTEEYIDPDKPCLFVARRKGLFRPAHLQPRLAKIELAHLR